MQNLPLFKDNKERRVFFIIIFLVFLFNIYNEYTNFTKFKTNEIYETKGTIVNSYSKENYLILKIKTKNFTFFTSTQQKSQFYKFQNINIYVVTQNIDFYSYLKGFYTKSFNLTIIKHDKTLKESLIQLIESQHSSKEIASLYSALFLASSLDPSIRELASNLGISHLIAISGFHLGLISFVLYFILHLLYNKVHNSLVPYRNKRFDIMIIVTILLFTYLLFLDLPASLLRAFVMFVFALFLLRCNIKLISFETLFIITIFIIALFPKLLFSLSLWFSIAGVFYIFLFLKYFKGMNKYLQLLIFNFWIYLAINPIVHYFFATTSLEQLFSPLLTILFTLFYPISVLLHMINLGGLFDGLLQYLINLDIVSSETFTPLWVFLIYLLISFFSTLKKEFFILLNIYIIVYNMWLFQSTFKEYLFIWI